MSLTQSEMKLSDGYNEDTFVRWSFDLCAKFAEDDRYLDPISND